MTAKEKAKELIDMFMDTDYTDVSIHGAKQLALKCVDEVVTYDYDMDREVYWIDVKYEIINYGKPTT